ncbi:MAG: hypothetical protein HUU54_17645, partial [Ignavibacteriaceae bacterium]|nr:hypothetical protein [Ignavibacteriaceae bacterium]
MKKFFYLVFILALLSAAETYSQGGGRQSSFNRDKLYWTAWDYSDGGIPKSLYDSAKFNTVIRQAKAGSVVNNLDELAQYPNIFAVNTNAQEWQGNIRQVNEHVQLDWLYAVTGGYYNEFYASRADSFELAGITTNQEFCLERGTDYFGDKKTITINGEEKECFSSGIDEAYKDKILVRGPHYYQHQGYELYSQDMDRPITYNAKFIIYPGDPTIPLNPQYNAPCVRVSVYYTDTVRQFPYDQSAPLMTRVYRFPYQEINATQLLNDPNLQLSYNYKNDIKDSNIIIERYYNNNEKLGTEFVIEWLGNAEILVYKVEVWDNSIWDKYAIDETAINLFRSKARWEFLNYFPSSSDFSSKLRGWSSLNEPHTVDLLRSFRFVDSLCALPAPEGFNTAPMFTMFYPNWDNNVDGRDFLKQIIEIAQPNPLFYWYYPFNVGHTDISGLYYFQTYALRSTALWLSEQSVNKYYPSKDWYYTAQSWGYRKTGTNEYFRWRQPTGQALRASIFAALAYGCKGIFIEPFDSYLGDQSANGYITEGLLEYIEPVPDTPRWNTLGLFVKDSLGERMGGILSSRLAKLEYESKNDIVTIRTNFPTEELREGVAYE